MTFKFKFKLAAFFMIASWRQPAGPRAGLAEALALALGARKTVAGDIGGWERPLNLAFRRVNTFKLKVGPSQDGWHCRDGQSAGATAPPVCAPSGGSPLAPRPRQCARPQAEAHIGRPVHRRRFTGPGNIAQSKLPSSRYRRVTVT